MNQAVDLTQSQPLVDQQLVATLPPARPPWQAGPFAEQDSDPLAGFANIMDVMLVFALGLMLALISQSNELRQHFNFPPQQTLQVHSGKELVEAPDAIKSMLQGESNGMESLGQVYRDPKTGKLILVGGQ